MLNRLTNKAKANFSIYKQELRDKGIHYLISARIKKVPALRKIYYLFAPNIVDVMGQKMIIDKQDTVISETLLTSGVWEKYQTELVRKLLKKGDTFLDIGAHTGYYAVVAAKFVGSSGRVFAFEPDPHNFSIMQKNIELNKYQNVRISQSALSNKNGELKLYLNPENRGDHRVYDVPGGKRKFVLVDTVKLDDYFKKEDNRVDVINIDIQGAEYKATIGMIGILKKNQGIKILTEFWPFGLKHAGDSAKKYLDLLKDLGFAFYDIHETTETLEPITVAELLKRYPEDEAYHTDLLCVRDKLTF
jgi:FkbM family methyltransferase